MTSPPNQPSILFEMYWSPETRKRLGLDGPGMHIIPTDEPYDRVKILGVEMTMDELRALLQRFVDEERRTQPAAALKRVAERLRKKVKSIRDWGWDPSATEESRARDDAHDAANEITRTTLNEVADALEEEAEELGR